MSQTKQQFEFLAGTGVVRSKVGTDFVSMFFGRIALPEHGQCYIDGLAGPDDAQIKLNVKRASDRSLVAHITLPRGKQEVRLGTLKETGKRRTWKLRATLRENDEGSVRMVLRLPEVKIAGTAAGW